MPPAREDGPIDYERRAQRMIQRWAGVRGPVRSDEERNNVTEIFTDRLSETQEQSFILGKNSFSKIRGLATSENKVAYKSRQL